MALKLCKACERHVRDSDATCPYCGGEEAAKVPAPTRVDRKAMYFAAVVMTTAAVETVSCSSVYGAPTTYVGCDGSACNYQARCERMQLSPVGERRLSLPSQACTEPVYRRLVDACVNDPSASDCPSVASSRVDCARCVIGPRGQEHPSDVPPGATLSLSPLIVNTGACAAAVLGRPDCAVHLTAHDVRVAENCSHCTDDDASSACRKAQRPTGPGTHPEWERVLECLALRDLRRAEWEPVCVGATPEESLDKTSHVLCFGQ
jgi:hypothetical protein